MSHKTIIDYEEGIKYRTDDPECTCRKCLVKKLEKATSDNKKLVEDIYELIEHPDSLKSHLIDTQYKVIKQMKKDMSDAFWFGSMTK